MRMVLSCDMNNAEMRVVTAFYFLVKVAHMVFMKMTL